MKGVWFSTTDTECLKHVQEMYFPDLGEKFKESELLVLPVFSRRNLTLGKGCLKYSHLKPTV
jgi:hypothetical protein